MRNSYHTIVCRLFMALSLLTISSSTWAETITATFDSGLPDGWTIVGDINNNDDRARSGKGLWTYSKAEKTNYVITTEMEGNIEFYARPYNKNGYGYITFYTVNADNTLGDKLTEFKTEKVSSGMISFKKYSFTLATHQRIAIDFYWACIDDFTYTPYIQSEGASMAVKIGTEVLISGGSYNFGLVDAGQTAQLVVDNNGTIDFNINVSTTNGYGVSPTTAMVKAGEQQLLTVTMPEVSTSGVLTVTGDGAGLSPFTLNLMSTAKDPNKMFVDFSDGMPEQWYTEGIGDYYGENYAWTATDGYAVTTAGSAMYAGALTTTAMEFSENEKLIFKAQKNGSSSWYTPSLTVQYLENGEWKNAGSAFTDITENEWSTYEVTIPASATKLRFNGWYVKIDDIYGGKLLPVTPKPKLEVVDYANGETVSWGFADVPAGTEKTITLKNDGKAELNVTIAATDDFTLSATQATVAANGGTFDLTIGTPAHDGNGTLTITPSADSDLGIYTLTLTSYYKVPKAIMELDKKEIVFGKVYANATDNITVTNTGDAELIATITNDNAERFEVNTQQLKVPAGESSTLAVTYLYDSNISGTYTANITLTPNDGMAQKITATARNKKQGVWSEDFEDGIPASWTNEGWEISRKWNEENTVNHAYAGLNSGYLITPRLRAEANEELTFDFISNWAEMKVEYAHHIDATEWVLLNTFTSDSTITFKAPEAGIYYLRFSGSGAYIDNFEGFVLDQLKADAAIIASSLPTTGNQYVAYEASVTVQNKGTEAQTAIARLLVNEAIVDTKEVELSIDGTTTIDLTFTPQNVLEHATACIEVTLKDVSDFTAKTVQTTLDIAAAPTLDETTAPELAEGTLPVVVLKYTAVNGWNTIAMPFTLNDETLTTIFGNGWKAFEFKGYDGKAMKLQQVSQFVAGYPYLIHAIETQSQTEGIVLKDVKIETTTAKYDFFNGIQFNATFEPIAVGEMTDKYIFSGEEPTLTKGTEDSAQNGFRAYITMDETVKNIPELIFLNKEGIPTGLRTTRQENKILKGIFNLNGQRVRSMTKGNLYILNGKKFLKK